MPITFRPDPTTEEILERLGREQGKPRSLIIREAITAYGTASAPTRPYDAIRHLIGIARGGPPDLSERTGERFREALLQPKPVKGKRRSR